MQYTIGKKIGSNNTDIKKHRTKKLNSDCMQYKVIHIMIKQHVAYKICIKVWKRNLLDVDGDEERIGGGKVRRFSVKGTSVISE